METDRLLRTSSATCKTRGGSERRAGTDSHAATAFDVGKTKVRECNKRYNERSGTMERKKCGDAGKKR
jgi:hypothetical protein